MWIPLVCCLYDGSGLSRYDALTPKQLVAALCHMKQTARFSIFYESLPIAGESGTLKARFKQAPFQGKLRAKSGTLSHVKGLAGYCNNQVGEELTFAIIINHYDGTSHSAEEVLEEILQVLFQQEKASKAYDHLLCY